jgi:hypothetical protein
MSQTASALVQPLSSCAVADFERRKSTRHSVAMQALSRPLDGQDAIWWGATVRDLSTTGIGLTLCFPFRPGTFLAVDLLGPLGGSRTLLTRVVHARDLADGTWHVGCEFVKPLSEGEVDEVVK